jgi:hypothetical protein
MAFGYTEIIDNAKAELLELKRRRGDLELEKAEIEAQIDALSKTLRLFAPLAGVEDDVRVFLGSLGETASPVGITDRIRSVLKTTLADQLSPAEVKDALQSNGWDLGKYKNATSTIQTILKRLVDSGEVSEVLTGDVKRFRWIKK